MYATIVSFVVKPFQVKAFRDRVDEIARDIATKQPGFVEHVILVSEQENRLVSVLSLWGTKTEADRYQEQVFPSTLANLDSLIDSGPVIHYYAALVRDSSTVGSKLSEAA